MRKELRKELHACLPSQIAQDSISVFTILSALLQFVHKTDGMPVYNGWSGTSCHTSAHKQKLALKQLITSQNSNIILSVDARDVLQSHDGRLYFSHLCHANMPRLAKKWAFEISFNLWCYRTARLFNFIDFTRFYFRIFHHCIETANETTQNLNIIRLDRR